MKFENNAKYMDLNEEKWYYKVGKKTFISEDLDYIIRTRQPTEKEISHNIGCPFKLTIPDDVFDHESWDNVGKYIGRTTCLIPKDIISVGKLHRILNKINDIQSIF